MLVKYWSNAGQMLVRCWPYLGALAPAVDVDEDVVRPHPQRQEDGQDVQLRVVAEPAAITSRTVPKKCSNL